MAIHFKHKTISILSAMLLTTSVSSSSFAQDDARTFSSAAGEVVNLTMGLAANENYAGALSKLRDLLSKTDLNPYERGTIYQMIGQYSYELGNREGALQAFENAIKSGGLLPKERDNMGLVTAQLMIGNGQYKEGAERLEKLLGSTENIKPQYIDLLVNAWVQAEDYPRALPWAEKWFAAANPKERRHYDLMNFLYNNLGQVGRQADIVKEMIDRWPNDKQLWENWTSMLANGGQEAEAFEATKIMYLKGMLTSETEILKVVQYYSFYDMPYQAAQILELEMDADRVAKGADSLKQLSGLYRQAREYERAIPILEAAAGLSQDRDTFAELGEALYNKGDCRKSEIAFTEAINRGYDAGKSWMLIATCRYDQTNAMERLECDMSDTKMAEAPITKARESAIAAFNKVPASSSERGNAAKWVQFIQAEQRAVSNRCEVNRQAPIELCFVKIKRAYDEAIFTKGFKLEDKSCEKYVAEYDAKYRSSQTGN